jgi:ribosome-associated translation inhibitor RaiA
MRITIGGGGVRVDDVLRTYIERRLRFALGRFGPRLERVVLRIADLNGRKGGEDKRCTVAVRLRPDCEVFVTHAHRDVRAAVDLAAERAGSAVAREIARRRDWRTARARLVPLAAAD